MSKISNNYVEEGLRCICGHLINKSHTINMKKTMATKNKVIAKCNFCKCKEICLE